MLDRPLDQRIREHKYRCAQSLVFGLPVIALQYFGHRLGGPESARWVAIMQVVLTGWILFVAATGMVSEGVMQFIARRKISADLSVALIATAVFIASLVPAMPRMFHIVVMLLVIWCGWRWFTLEKSARRGPGSAARSES